MGNLSSAPERLRWFAYYLLAALITAYILTPTPSWTLLLLLGLSAWHFGEPFGQAKASNTAQRGLRRVVLGGAPVMLPALLQRPALQALVTSLVGPDALAISTAWNGWSLLAALWLTALTIWLILTWWPRTHRTAQDHRMILEITVLAMLYTAASPLMGFALFFGIYHAGSHIQRVMRNSAYLKTLPHYNAALIATTALTALLSAALAWHLHQLAPVLTAPDWALRTAVLALACVSVPHTVLIGWWAHRLRTQSTAPGALRIW
jgi:Brp/Blh family beta-carotene 15,15'-monooxygenase